MPSHCGILRSFSNCLSSPIALMKSPSIFARSVGVSTDHALETFATVRDGMILFNDTRGKLSEQQAMVGFRRAYGLSVSEIRSSPHVLCAGAVSNDLSRGASQLAHSSLSDNNLALIVEGLSRLEISCTDLLVSPFRHDLIIKVLKHCCSHQMQSGALSSSVVQAVKTNLQDVTNEQLIEYLPYLSALGKTKAAFSMLSILTDRLRTGIPDMAYLPYLVEFCSRMDCASWGRNLVENYEDRLLSRPDVLVKLAGHCHLPSSLLRVVIEQLQNDLNQFPVSDLARATLAVGKKVTPDLEKQLVLRILSQPQSLSHQQLVDMMRKFCAVGLTTMPENDALECVSYLCVHMPHLSARDLCIAMDFSLLLNLDVENFVHLTALEITSRISTMPERQHKFLHLLMLINKRDFRHTSGRDETCTIRLVAALLTADELRPMWVYDSIATLMSGGPYLLSNLVRVVSIDSLCHLPSSFLQSLVKVALEVNVPLIVMPFVHELVKRVDEIESAIEMLVWLSDFLPFSSNEELWQRTVQQIISKSSHTQPPQKWLDLLHALRGSTLVEVVSDHVTSLIQSGHMHWQVRSVVEVVISLASANINCVQLVKVLSQMPNIVQELEVLPMLMVVNLVCSCGHLGIGVPLNLQQPLLAERYNVLNKINLQWALLASGSADLAAWRSLLPTISVDDLSGSSIDVLRRLQQLHIQVIMKHGDSAALTEDSADFVASKVFTECQRQQPAGLTEFAAFVEARAGEKFVLRNCLTTGGSIVDIALQLDVNRQPVTWADGNESEAASTQPGTHPLVQRTLCGDAFRLSGVVPQARPTVPGVKRFAVLLLDDQEHYISGSKRVVGSILVRALQLKLLGWTVVKVPLSRAAEVCSDSDKQGSSFDIGQWLAQMEKD